MSDSGTIDHDLACLRCRYNLRGLHGDPVTCPECGFRNPRGVAEIPAEMIRRRLVVIESTPAGLVGVLVLLALLALPSVWIAELGDPLGFLCCGLWIAAPLLAAVLAARFAAACSYQPGWRWLLARYVALGLGASAVLCLLVFGYMALRFHQRSLFGELPVVAVVIGTAVLAAVYRPYRALRRRLDEFQHDFVEQALRDESRRRRR